MKIHAKLLPLCSCSEMNTVVAKYKFIMTKKKILFISQEIEPYTSKSDNAHIGRYLPQGIQEKGKEIRTFMPRFGTINERRHQLHEVIRLSGMNLIIDDGDHPLLIKVASIQAARMQIYFIDNDDYFTKRKNLVDENGEFSKDNDERITFFAKGVFETVKKLRWSPDIIYCQGWFTSMVPLMLKKEYKDDPTFANSKVVFSCCNDAFNETLDTKLKEKILTENIKSSDVELLSDPTYDNICKLAMDYSDAIIINNKDVKDELKDYATKSGKTMTTYSSEEEYINEYDEFFNNIIEK